MQVQVRRDGDLIAFDTGFDKPAYMSFRKAATASLQLIDAANDLAERHAVAVASAAGTEKASDVRPDATTPGLVWLTIDGTRIPMTPLHAIEVARQIAVIGGEICDERDQPFVEPVGF